MLLASLLVNLSGGGFTVAVLLQDRTVISAVSEASQLLAEVDNLVY